MLYRIFTLHPELFNSFTQTSLIARGIEKKVIALETVNWRDDFGIGKYKQVDDKPYGGGSGMVLMADPIFNSLQKYNAISSLYKDKTALVDNNLDQLQTFITQLPEKASFDKMVNYHKKVLPNNSQFEQLVNNNKAIKKVTVSLTPRGFPIDQRTMEWLAANFEEMNILCGRYEGFDARVSEIVDLELSLGNFVTNGGEVPAMALIEGVSRLLPEFITKTSSVTHDSFSSGLNQYNEQAEFVYGKKQFSQNLEKYVIKNKPKAPIFSDSKWIDGILPHLEHPQYTRPESWQEIKIPPILLSGNHKLIQSWRYKWY